MQFHHYRPLADSWPPPAPCWSRRRTARRDSDTWSSRLTWACSWTRIAERIAAPRSFCLAFFCLYIFKILYLFASSLSLSLTHSACFIRCVVCRASHEWTTLHRAFHFKLTICFTLILCVFFRAILSCWLYSPLFLFLFFSSSYSPFSSSSIAIFFHFTLTYLI